MLFHNENSQFLISTKGEFDSFALDLFRFQSVNNKVYRSYLEALKLKPEEIRSTESIPFLPISLFKTKKVVSGSFAPEAEFRSSGTSGQEQSVHSVRKLSIYKESFLRSFTNFYGDPSAISIYALLPSYLERQDSSLVYMADHLIKCNRHGRGGFFLDNYKELLDKIAESLSLGEDVLLLGVSFALIDLADKFAPDLSGIKVMETGGMKGRRKEMTRDELHSILREGMNIKAVYSEYGMTELLSQAWSSGNGIFRTPPWMKVIIRDPLDPWSILPEGRSGGINIIDLANIYSCSFIETADLGVLQGNDTFELIGRFDNSDIRGCNLLTL